MAVVYDADAEVTGENVTSLSVSLTVSNNSNRYMIVGVAGWDAAVGDSLVSSVTFGGSATGWSQIITEIGPGAATDRSSLWGKAAPAAITSSVVVAFGGTASEGGINALVAYNVNQSTPLGTASSAQGRTGTASTTVVAAVGDLVYDAVYHGGANASGLVGANQTQLANVTLGQANSTLYASREAGSATVVMSWTLTADSNQEWVQTAVALKAAGGLLEHPGMTGGMQDLTGRMAA